MDKNINLKQIGQRLRSTRLDRGLSQEDLSFESGVAVANISDIELGKKDIRISRMSFAFLEHNYDKL